MSKRNNEKQVFMLLLQPHCLETLLSGLLWSVLSPVCKGQSSRDICWGHYFSGNQDGSQDVLGLPLCLGK